MAKPWRRVAALLGAVLTVWTSPARSLDLLQAYGAAQLNDTTLRVAQQRNAAGQERPVQARAGLLPSVSLSASRTSNDLSSSNVANGANGANGAGSLDSRYQSGAVNLTLRQPIYNAAQRAIVRRAEAEAQASQAALRREQQNMALRLIGTYVEALKAGDEVALAAAQVNFYTRQLDAARKSFAAGAGTRTDAEEVEARLDLTLALQLQAQQAVGYAQRRLQVLVGLPATELAPLNGARLLAQQPDIGSLENWIARSEASSPEIAAAANQVVAASEEATRARAAHQPTVEAVGLWSRSDRDNVNAPGYRFTNRSVSIQLNVPLYAGGEVDSQVRQADAEREAANQGLQSLRLDVALRVHREFRGVADGTAKVRALEKALRSADQVVVSTQKSYSAGSRSVIDVLNAEQQRASVLRDLAQARYAYLMAYAGLLALVDGLDTETLTRMNAWFGA